MVYRILASSTYLKIVVANTLYQITSNLSISKTIIIKYAMET